MGFWKRIKNIVELSKFEPGKPQDEYKEPGTQIITLVQKPTQKAVFIPRLKRNPVDEIVNEQNQ